jgi:hypothetical protein
MICHVVLIRLKAEVSPADTATFMTQARETLAPIPGVRNLRVGEGLGVKAERSYPVALVMEFDDDAALEAYQVHAEHQRFVRDIVGPIQDDKQVYDYRC